MAAHSKSNIVVYWNNWSSCYPFIHYWFSWLQKVI